MVAFLFVMKMMRQRRNKRQYGLPVPSFEFNQPSTTRNPSIMRNICRWIPDQVHCCPV